MKISARNVFEGKISALALGPVSAEAEITTKGGDTLVATLTQASAQSLGLAVGRPVFALIKASSVMLMTDAQGVKLSARNSLAGQIARLVLGPVNAEVAIALPGGSEVFASITRDAAEALDLKEGAAVTALIKASAVILGTR